MQNRMNKFGALLFAGALALSGCSADDGANGANGTNGQDGTDGMSGVTGGLKLVIDGVVTADVSGTNTSTLTFTVYPAAAVCPGGACDATLSNLTRKTFYATEYDAATKTFGGPDADRSFSFGNFQFKAITADGKGAQYTATKASPTFAPEKSQTMVYGYITDAHVLPVKGSYEFPDNVASASKVYGAIDYTSAANVSGCEKCHVAPYSKHGYRQAAVAGLPDFAACKACHYDARNGGHQAWQLLVDDPAAYAAQNGQPTADQKTKYAYKANIMNDVHMSHGMEFAYPQSMSNCVTCHEGKLDVVLADKFFKLSTCKSCHPVTAVGGTDSKRAPALTGNASAVPPVPGVVPHNNLETLDCAGCHKAGGMGPTFAQIHSGRTATIYAADGTRYSDVFTTKVDSASFDKATNVLTVNFSATKTGGASITQTAADIVPTVVVSLYGYGTKDFVVGGHGTHTDGQRNLEATAGTANNRITFSGTAPSWTATIDLSTWAADIGADLKIERAEVAILPKLLSDLAVPTSPSLAIKGAAQTVDLVGATTLVADKDSYGKAIVDPAKCNKCHEALGTTFHNASYGSAGVVACRTCHIVGNGGGHLEMQSRSIDSYVHAIHSMQPFDNGLPKPVSQWTAKELADKIDFADPVEAMRYEHHIESTYPSFSILNCDSCHNAGTYDVPNQAKSLPSILSASNYLNGATRAISGVPSYIVGPASRACGSCHRAELINEDDAGTLAAFNQHTASFGTLVLAGTSTEAPANLDAVTQSLMAKLGGPTFGGAVPAGTQLESCAICHPNAGADHQAAFNRWTDGL